MERTVIKVCLQITMLFSTKKNVTHNIRRHLSCGGVPAGFALKSKKIKQSGSHMHYITDVFWHHAEILHHQTLRDDECALMGKRISMKYVYTTSLRG